MSGKSSNGNSGQDGSVIFCQDVFTRLRKQNAARAQARRYFETTRRTAIQRRLVLRVLNRDRETPGLHSVD